MVREHRLRLGLSQAEVAERAGVAERTLRNIEAGRIAKPRPATVRLLADTFDLQGTERDGFCAAALSPDEAAAPPSAPTAPGVTVPEDQPGIAQLPAEVADFTGRAGNLLELSDVLGRRGASMLTVAITGTAGVGKTTLAVHWAHRVGHRYPDGQLYVNLRGFDPDHAVVPPVDALAGLLTALGLPPHRMPAEETGRAALYRSMLSGRRVLVLLDNARDAEQVRPLLPGAAGCLVVVTSRNQLTSLVAVEGAHPVPLDVLTGEEARRLIAGRIGAARVAAEPDAVAGIIARCARLPLALSIVSARAAITRTPLAALAGELAESAGALDALDGGDAISNVRTVFSWSYRALSEDARRMFRLLGVHPGEDVDAWGAAAAAGLPIDGARAVLGELTRASLLTGHRPGRWTFHDLLRAYAAGEAAPDEADAALERLLDHYLYTAATAMDVLHPAEAARRPRVDPPATATPPLPDSATARDLLDAERANLVAVAGHAAHHRWPEHAVKFGTTLFRYLDQGGHYSDGLVLHGHALRAAERTGQVTDRAQALSYLGTAYLRAEMIAEGTEHYRRALALYEGVGDIENQGRLLNNLGGVHLMTGDGPQAVSYLERSLPISRRLRNRRDTTIALGNLGVAYELVGRYAEAAEHFEQMIALCQETIPDGEATARNQLGVVYRRQGRYAEALDAHLTALTLHHDMGNYGGEINFVRVNIAIAYRLSGRLREAADHARLALTGAREQGDRRAEAAGLAVLGLLDVDRGVAGQAVETLRRAVELNTEVGDRAGLTNTRNALGTALGAAGRPDGARAEHEAALALAVETADLYEQAQAHHGLSRAHRALGDHEAAARHGTRAYDQAAALRIPLAEQYRASLA